MPGAGLAAGQSDTAPTITITPLVTGDFATTIVVDSTGSNAGGYSGVLPETTLTVIGTMGPTPYSQAVTTPVWLKLAQDGNVVTGFHAGSGWRNGICGRSWSMSSGRGRARLR